MNTITRREFSQLWAGIFAFLCGMKVEADPTKDNAGYWEHRIGEDVPLDWKIIEKGLADTWKRWNDPKRMGGQGILQDLMLGTYRSENPKDFDPWVSDRERKIVATIIQWLGTNVGRCFLYEASEAMGRAQYPFQRAIDKWHDDCRIERLQKELQEARAEIRKLKG